MDNPLYDEQREKAGSETLTKYFYQYHWALCEVLEKQARSEKYIVFIEVHEDVVFSDSLDKNGHFDFYQIKNTKSQTLNALSKVPKKKQNSIIGKCILSVHDKNYSDKVTSINIVVSQGFSFKNDLNSNTNLKIIKTSDFKNKSLEDLQKKVNIEIGNKIDITSLQFLKSDLPYDSLDAMEKQLIGHVSQVISKLFPNAKNNSENSYRILIDDLVRKGVRTYDFDEWDKFIDGKGLTSEQVNAVLQENTSDGFEEIITVFDDINDDLGIAGAQKHSLRKKLQRLHSDIIFRKSDQYISAFNKTTKHFKEINVTLETISDSTIETISKKLALPSNIEKYIMIIYCIIQEVLGEEQD